MKKGMDRPTRVAADLMDAAAVEGERQSRSAKQQLDQWARVGRAVSAQTSAVPRGFRDPSSHLFDVWKAVGRIHQAGGSGAEVAAWAS